MKKKKLLKNILSCILSFVLLCSLSLFCIAESFYETQYDYDTSDIAWLSDVTFKLNLDTVSGIINSLTLKPISDYPYSETADSFKNDVDNFANINLLNEGAPRAAYIYFFELISSSEGLVAGEMSDSDIKSFFKAQGIDFDLGNDKDSLIVARAVYTAIVSGVLTDYASGSSLDNLAVDFICSLSGMDKESLKEWLPSTNDPALDDYLLAASKAALWTAGYDVDSSTEEKTVYKLMACMVIENNGITADISSDFNTLKLKFLSAMLSKKYGISTDWETVGQCLENDSLPLYILKTIGMRDGVSVGDRNFEDSFEFICEHTNEFDLENQFYADIYNYSVELNSDVTKLWINATPVCSNGTVTISANNTVLKNSYYTGVEFDSSKENTITVTVTSVQGASESSCSYVFTFVRSSVEETTVVNDDQISEAVDKLFLSSETLLSGLLVNINLDTSSDSILAKSLSAFDEKSKSALTVIAPTFDDSSESNSELKTQEECIDFLDKIGSLVDSSVSGIEGIPILSELSSNSEISDFITFN